MKHGVLGTGDVGRTVASALVGAGHEARMGSRSADNEAASEWAAGAGEAGGHGTFSEVAAWGEMNWNCTSGEHALEALALAGGENLAGKVLVDLANPLDFSQGFPPSLSVCNDDSLAERIQEAFPDARVVKALNTVNVSVMFSPGVLPEPTDLFLAGDDEAAKDEVATLLESFGWEAGRLRDLGDLTAARGLEAWLLLWVRLFMKHGTGEFNVRLVGL